MSKMKYQKEFEELASNNPDLLGGNTLAIQTEHYGVPLDTPEYASSYVRLTYNIFCKVKEQLEQEIKTLKEQLAEEIEQRQKAEDIVWFYSDLKSWQLRGDGRTCIISRDRQVVMGSNFGGKLARQYFAEKEKQDKENKENKND